MFVILVLVLAFRPQGLLGSAARERGRLAQGDELRGGPPRLAATRAGPRGRARVARAMPGGPTAGDRRRGSTCRGSRGACGARHVLVLLAALIYPWVATPFFTFQIGAQALALGLIALSLTFLGRLRRHGLAGADDGGRHRRLRVRDLRARAAPRSACGWPWWLAVSSRWSSPRSGATLIGWLSVRTEGIYTIMITLAIGVAFFYLAQQNYAVFNGFQGFQRVLPPTVFGRGAARPRCRSTTWRCSGRWPATSS